MLIVHIKELASFFRTPYCFGPSSLNQKAWQCDRRGLLHLISVSASCGDLTGFDEYLGEVGGNFIAAI